MAANSKPHCFCTGSKYKRHNFATSTYICAEGTFKGQLILLAKCTNCPASFETLFERALTIKQTI